MFPLAECNNETKTPAGAGVIRGAAGWINDSANNSVVADDEDRKVCVIHDSVDIQVCGAVSRHGWVSAVQNSVGV
jgi:hypothetical protein